MASSSSQTSSGPKLGRNASFFGAIRNIVAAPLTWLAGADQDEQGSKRRHERIVQQSDSGQDDGTPRKRMRVRSPPRASGYNDPPQEAFVSRPKRRSPAPVARSSSASLSNLKAARLRHNFSRSSMSPAPALLARTMSIDPPMGLRRESSLADIIMDSEVPLPPQRDHSMPPAPLAARPSFRMRASLTPQPQPREISEPPSLSHLVAHPVFVRAPPAPQQETRRITTLGNIAESVKTERSPRRSVSSLFGKGGHLDPRNRRAESAPVEKALEELDIYRTPLVPTRLRSAYPSSSASTIPDMFKSRRASQLILMDDDRDRKKTKASHKSPKNVSKPYAGEGGMKKLLARRKKEQDGDRLDEESDDTPAPSVREKEPTRKSKKPEPEEPVKPPPKPASDWFAAASAGAAPASGGSSLRVGRNKISRNHIARPTMPRSRLQFSAVYEDDGDDAMDGEEEARQKEHAMLEEASKKLPAFEIPAGFSFAKPESKPLQNDLTNATEPPITSLPFTFGKPASLPETSKAETSTSRKENSEFVGFGTEASTSKPTRSLADAPPLGAPGEVSEVKRVETDSKPAANPFSSTGMPNFFGNSAIAAKPLSVPSVPPMTFGGSSSLFGSHQQLETLAATTTALHPTIDKENPFWESDAKAKAKAESETLKSSSLFSVPAASSSTSGGSAPFSFEAPKTTAPAPSTSLPFTFGNAGTVNSATESKDVQGQKVAETQAEAPKPLFGGFGTQTSSTATTEAPKFGLFAPPTAAKPEAAPQTNGAPAPFSFGAPSTAAKAEPPKPLFGGTTETKSLFGSSAAPAAEAPKSLFGSTAAPAVEAPKSLFGSTAAPVEAPKSLFGQAAAPAVEAPKSLFGSAAAPSAEASKPMFGNGSGFSFNKPAEEKSTASSTATTTAPAPFTFGVTPSAPSSSTGTSAPFTFGSSAPAAAPAAPTPFSFGASNPAPTEAPKAAFSFGTPATLNPTDRPSTPPKNADQEFRMEESPTRELQPASKPMLNFGGFGNSSAPSTLFSAPPPINTSVPPTSTFAFGAAAANPFSSPAKPEEPKPFAFSATPTPTPTTAAPFTFGPSKSTGSEAPRPSTGGGFSFSGAATPTTAAPFSFGSNAASNPFGSAGVGSAPGSPSTFNQPSPFGFNNPSLPAVTNNGFSFGSQPASPAAAPSGLPSTGFGAQSSGFGQAQPSSPFAPPLALSNSSGGTLFTMGSSSPANGRPTRKLPNRRGGKR